MTYVVISYDISDDKTRSNVANVLKDYGKRVQYSVFECRVDARTLERLVARLKPFAEGRDSIRVYPLCDACLKNVVLLGNGKLIEEPAFHFV
jgi:CRISPR-associated protein Cas2